MPAPDVADQSAALSSEHDAEHSAMAAANAELTRLNAELDLARASARLSEERLRSILRAAAIGTFDLDPATGHLVWDDRCRELFGIAPGEPVSYEGTFLPHLHPDDRERAREAVEGALAPEGSGTFDIEYRTVGRDDGIVRWVAAKGSRVQFATGERFLGTVRDVTARRMAELAQRETAERYRLASRATNDAIWDWDLRSDHVTWNEALYEAHGYAHADVRETGTWWVEHIHPDDRDAVTTSIHAVIDGCEDRWTHDYRFQRGDGTYALVKDRGFVLRDSGGRALRMVGAMMDMTERQQAEDHRHMLINELQHRVKNTLAIIQAIAGQTFKDTPADLREVFSKRLVALSHANEIITGTGWKAAPVRQVVESATMPHSAAERFTITGPEVEVAARLAVSLTLALHELCTNATKYGALRVEGGSVRIDWRIEDGEFRLTWTERGGPPVEQPTTTGFGSRLIQRSLGSQPGAKVTMDFRPGGLCCEFTAPAASITDAAPE